MTPTKNQRLRARIEAKRQSQHRPGTTFNLHGQLAAPATFRVISHPNGPASSASTSGGSRAVSSGSQTSVKTVAASAFLTRTGHSQMTGSSATLGATARPVSKEKMMGDTAARLESLVDSAAEWSVELEIAPPSDDALRRARRILSFIDLKTRDEFIRIFPSENAGIVLQRRDDGITRVLDIDPGVIQASIHDNETHRHFPMYDERSAAAFLAAS